MDIKALSQLKSKFVAREVGNELVLVPLSGNVAQMTSLFTLNETARFVWDNLNDTNTIEDIQSLMLSEFEVDAATANADIEAFLNRLTTTFS